MSNIRNIVIMFFLILFQNINGGELSKHLSGLQNFIDRKFKGNFYNSTKEKPLIDVIHFERILNGSAICITHSVNDGKYGGKYIIIWNSDLGKVESYYFSTGGEIRVSKARIHNEEIIIEDDYLKNKNGIKKVKKTYKLNDIGYLENHIEYLMNNLWVKTYEINYVENDSVKIIFQ